MSFEPPIRRMAVEAFRGFRDRQDFELAASAVVVSGPNGTGKTSFFDAIQWCLLGSIQRLEGLRARKNVEHIVNQYRLHDRATVEVELLVEGRSVILRRTGDHRSSTLEFSVDGAEPVFGDEATRLLEEALSLDDNLTLEMALTTSGLMQQDVMRAVLEAKPTDRYRHISTVLGLSALEEFEAVTRDLAKEAKSREDAARQDHDSVAASLSEAKARLATEQQRVQTLPQVEVLRSEVLEALRGVPPLVTIDPSAALADPVGVRALAGTSGELIEQVERFAGVWADAEGSRRDLSPEPTDEDIGAARAAVRQAKSALATANESLAGIEAQLAVAKSASDETARLAALAIPLLAEACPVCGQSIDASQVEQELRARASNSATILALQTQVDEQRQAALTASEAVATAEEHDRALASSRQLWQRVRNSAREAESVFDQMTAPRAYVSFGDTSPAELYEGTVQIAESLRSARRRILEFLNTLEEGVDRGPLQRAESEVASLAEALHSRDQRLGTESARAQRLKSLAEQAVDARVEVTETRFRAVQPLVGDIFGRLDPHPAFKAIEFELDTYYKRGTTSPMVRDVVEDVSADPLLVFSTSQANIAALSYFLAMGWSAGDRGLPFVLLDDPVQSMDDVNVLGFADLSRHLRKTRQLVISTHERRLAGLLERKLAPRSEDETTIVLEFVGWDRTGPSVEHREVASQHVNDPIRVVQAAS